MAVVILVLFASSGTAHAQSQSRSQSYWQYAASGRLNTVVTADVNGDGIDEFLVLDENSQLTLLTANGHQEWSYLSPRPISTIGALSGSDALNPVQDIVMAGLGHLMLLDSEGNELWRVPLPDTAIPVETSSYDFNRDGIEDILVLLASGQLLAYSPSGDNLWQFAGQENLTTNVNPHMIVDDFDGDGEDEIVLGLFTPRRFSEILYLDNGSIQWRQAISRRITALVAAPFNSSTGNLIAVGTNFGQLALYSPAGELAWFRTVNRAITSLTFTELPDEQVLAVGTESGSVIAYTAEGRRLWTNNLAKDANRRVLALLPAGGRTAAGRVPLAAILEPVSESSELADILLLGNNGQTLAKLNDTDLPDLTRLVDVNGDSHHELLLARFATLQLIGLGIGDSEYIQEWEYALDAAPTASLVVDLDEDGEEEIIVGTRDGRLHSLGVDRMIRWLNAPGEEIAYLGHIRYSLSEPPRIAVVRRQRLSINDVADEEVPGASWLELRNATGERLWEVTIPARVTALTLDDRLGSGEPSSILIGTLEGRILAYNLDGSLQWQYNIEDLAGGVRSLVVFNEGVGKPNSVLVVGSNRMIRLLPLGSGIIRYNLLSFENEIMAVYPIQASDGQLLSVGLVAFTADGYAHGLNQRGIEMAQWPQTLSGSPGAIEPSGQSSLEVFQENMTGFLIATEGGNLEQLTISDNQPIVTWNLEGIGPIAAISWDDLDKDGRPDIGAIGARDGKVWLYEQIQTPNPRRFLELSLASSAFDLALLKRTSRQSPDLLAITQNGLIRLFREEENRPPLLTHPQVEMDQNQFSIGVQVNDVENDSVAVQLELHDEINDTWLPLSEQKLATGNGQLFWPGVTVPDGTTRINYRFRFSDGFYRGYVTPPAGPEVVPGAGREIVPVLAGSVGLLLLAGVVAYLRQAQTPAAQAGRFYGRLTQERTRILPLLEQRYASVSGSPDFLLQLANSARRAGDANLANLADGLFLLANRPQAGLPIITHTLDDVTATGKEWEGLSQHQLVYKTCQAMLEAPSIPELVLVRPQFVHLLVALEEKKEWSPILETLLPVLTNMRDSERVEAANDRLVYLNQAAVRLRQVQDQLPQFTPSVERTLVRAIARRWAGLLTAEIEEQRGRAELEVSLMTKRLAPNGQTHVAMEIRNTGRAAAENIVAVLDDNPAYLVRSEPQVIPFLPSGHSRQVRFLIEPQAEERFRVGLSLTYDDRNRHDKRAAFGDMVHLLPPIREFVPVANPYLPGTPLRKDSPLFFGREDLFDFIAEHAGSHSQRNVFMLVGQRRTGKTSLLLRLEEYLPPQLLPVYIDCQSLGVSPGMPALLQEFAWHIADALNARGIELTVPELAAWQSDPTRVLQREFLPAVRRLLLPDMTLLLVFDEFEAFESMVADGILPRTFFPYMRHLMQHSNGLGFVFVGTRRLEEMSADYWSVLFNIALYRKIDFLSPDAALRLICEPVAPHLIYDDLALDKILRVTAGHPYFLQLVCYTLVKQANQQKTGYVTISDVNVALDEMLRLGEVHFAYLWQRSNPAERAVLAAVSRLMDRNEPLHPEEIIDYLESYSIEPDPAEVTHALNSLVERDVMREVTEEGKSLYELRIGLVGQWVAQNKSLSKLHVHLES